MQSLVLLIFFVEKEYIFWFVFPKKELSSFKIQFNNLSKNNFISSELSFPFL